MQILKLKVCVWYKACLVMQSYVAFKNRVSWGFILCLLLFCIQYVMCVCGHAHACVQRVTTIALMIAN